MKINLLGGDTQARSVVASTQRVLNLYSEVSDRALGEPFPVTHYPTPGLTKLASTPNGLPIRGLYRASNGELYAVAGFDVYYVDTSWIFHSVGSMVKTTALHPTKMADNGTNIILCDGTTNNGYSIVMATRSGFAFLGNPDASDQVTTSSTGWLGSTFVDFTDTYLLANFINTPTFYISNSEDIIFDPLQFAGKSAYPDPLVAAIVQHRVVWLIGVVSTEIWYNEGGTSLVNNFPFSIMPGVAIDWGCHATYSIAKGETQIFWLAQNLNGEVVVLRGSGYSITRISTHALEYQFSTYSTTADCIAYVHMVNGHSFYVMNFPTADKTWAFDLNTKEWHERCTLDAEGVEHRHLADCHAFVYDNNVVNDYSSPNLYRLDLNAYNDNGMPIKRLIGFPRQIEPDGDHRLVFRNFVAEMAFGETLTPGDQPILSLRWSDDKGKTWSAALEQPLGGMGEFNRFVKFQRLGMSRNRVFQLEWQSNGFTALQGAFVEFDKAGS